jgi:HPt (histidine-containing phosphotransfer) domain-containing protein
MSSNNRLTDLTYLTDLSKGNEKFVDDMIAIFLEENPREIEMLREGIEKSDFDMIRAYAHKLRSTIPFVGIERLIEDDVAEVERLAYEEVRKQEKDNNQAALAEIRTMFSKISEVCNNACEELSRR